METKGVIYILTNPSFPEYVKIGYADDIQRRLKQLNRSECVPFAFRVYATYDVADRLSDIQIHNIIDSLNPNLRSIETFEGKKRVREFYAMTKEDAFKLLEGIAKINGLTKNLKLHTPTQSEVNDTETANEVKEESIERRSPFSFYACGIKKGELMAYINIKHPGGGFDLNGKIKASNFVQKKEAEHIKEKITSNPVVKLPTADMIVLPEDKQEKLSVIIAEINSRTGKSYDNDVAIKAMLQIRDLLLKSDKLRKSAKNNTIKDFEFSYFDDIDDALIEGLSQNQDFFSLLLNNEELKRQVLGIFTDEIYKSLRNDDEDKPE